MNISTIKCTRTKQKHECYLHSLKKSGVRDAKLLAQACFGCPSMSIQFTDGGVKRSDEGIEYLYKPNTTLEAFVNESI